MHQSVSLTATCASLCSHTKLYHHIRQFEYRSSPLKDLAFNHSADGCPSGLPSEVVRKGEGGEILAYVSWILGCIDYLLELIVQVIRAKFVSQVLVVSLFFILLASYTVKVIC